MTRQVLIQLRANMLGGMNEYVKCFNDEEAYYDHWIYLVPDECTEDDFCLEYFDQCIIVYCPLCGKYTYVEEE